MNAALHASQRCHVETQAVSRLFLCPPVRSPQLDHPSPNVSHHAVRALHPGNVPWLDSAETEGKYTRLRLSNTVSNTTMKAALTGNFDGRAREVATGGVDRAQKWPS